MFDSSYKDMLWTMHEVNLKWNPFIWISNYLELKFDHPLDLFDQESFYKSSIFLIFISILFWGLLYNLIHNYIAVVSFFFSF